MKFEKYLIIEGAESASHMEQAIVDVWNDAEKPKYPAKMPVAEKIVGILKSQHPRIHGEAHHYGSAKGTIRKDWIGYDSTPKTDLSIGNFHISLKQSGESHLISSQKNETDAIFHAVLNHSPKVKNKTEAFINEMEGVIKDMVQLKADHSITDLRKGKGDIDISEYDKINTDLAERITNMLSNNKEFKDAVVREAAVGEYKFVPNSQATVPSVAEYMLVFDKSGKWVKLNALTDPAFISKLSNKTRVAVRWKSRSSRGKYNLNSSLRMLTTTVKEEFDKHGDTLNEGKIRDIISKVISKFKEMWNKISKWLKESVTNIFEFLGIDVTLQISSTKL